MAHSTDTPATAGPSHEEIAARAYELYLEHGAQPGHDVDDWLEAERELSEQATARADGETAAAEESPKSAAPPAGRPKPAKASAFSQSSSTPRKNSEPDDTRLAR